MRTKAENRRFLIESIRRVVTEFGGKCAVCDLEMSRCICPICPVCGVQGDPDCLDTHGVREMPTMSATRNEWRQVAPHHWTCTYWDVWFRWGEWYVGFYCGPRIARTFRTAQEAMRFVDTTDFDDGQVRT